VVNNQCNAGQAHNVLAHQQQSLTQLCLIAGEGHLPCHVAADAVAKGIAVTAFCLQNGNRAELERITGQKTYAIKPGLLQYNIDLAARLGLANIVFAGKVNKWLLLKNPQLDKLALTSLRKLWPRNDDNIMLALIQLLSDLGLTIWPQAMFLGRLMIGPNQLGPHAPTAAHWDDVAFGFNLARHMGALDVGQTVVVQNGMALAIEAIEGTDQCLLRAGKQTKKRAGAVVVKVAKPNQDPRFDIPTVGVRTLKTMHKAGLSVLATQAHQTLYLDADAMAQYAAQHGLVIVSTTDGQPSIL
jgi:UDP-2,3-diacylglucosamine hydrolase